MKTELKPCKICNSVPERCTMLGYDLHSAECGNTFSVKGYHVECFKCLRKTEVHKTIKAAEEEWNKANEHCCN